MAKIVYAKWPNAGTHLGFLFWGGGGKVVLFGGKLNHLGEIEPFGGSFYMKSSKVLGRSCSLGGSFPTE